MALGGTGYAAINLPRNSVGTRQIRSGAVTSAKVRDQSLSRTDFGRGQLPGATRPAAWALIRGGNGKPVIENARGAARIDRVAAGIFDLHFKRSVRNCSIAVAPFQETVIVSGFTSHEIENISDDVVRISFWDARSQSYADNGAGFINVFC